MLDGSETSHYLRRTIADHHAFPRKYHYARIWRLRFEAFQRTIRILPCAKGSFATDARTIVDSETLRPCIQRGGLHFSHFPNGSTCRRRVTPSCSPTAYLVKGSWAVQSDTAVLHIVLILAWPCVANMRGDCHSIQDRSNHQKSIYKDRQFMYHKRTASDIKPQDVASAHV